ncbi:hypothetical protein Tco_1418733 [Tanacetum coccineum]
MNITIEEDEDVSDDDEPLTEDQEDIHHMSMIKIVDVVQGRESPPNDNNKKEDVHDTHSSDQQDVKDNHVNESLRVEPEKDVHNSTTVNLDSFIRDPGARPSISSFPSDHQDEIRHEYIRLVPYQLSKHKYPLSRGGPNGRMRSFQEVRFKRFWWLEYSETKDAAYCLPCYLFNKKPVGRVGSDRFTKQGFNKWKKVDVVQGRESPPDDNDKKEDVHDIHPSDQQDVKDNHVNESLRVEPGKDVHNSTAVNLDSFIRDPGVRPSISSFPSDHQDEIRREYIRLRPYQLSKHKYPLSRGGPNGLCEAFKKYSLKDSGGWNIQRQRMLHIVYLVIFSIRSPLDELVLIGLPSKGSTSGKR